jgi:hypothetical protein
MAVLPSGTTRIIAPRSAVMIQKHPTKGRRTSAASMNRLSARWTTVLVMLIPERAYFATVVVGWGNERPRM